jgi:DNA-binding MarR family transcriptional regulator
VAELDSLIHQPARLRIMAALTALPPEARLDFTTLGRLLKLTDGNLGAHLSSLEEAGYIQAEKMFVDKKPRTRLSATKLGRAKFRRHVEALRGIIENAEQPGGGTEH